MIGNLIVVAVMIVCWTIVSLPDKFRIMETGDGKFVVQGGRFIWDEFRCTFSTPQEAQEFIAMVPVQRAQKRLREQRKVWRP